MKNQSSFKKIMSTIAIFIPIVVVAYGFLALVNWTLNTGEWNGFSRFILGVIGIVCLLNIFEEL